jgi:phosphoglycerate kinase
VAIKYIDQLDIHNKKLLIRVDFNVPFDKDGNITDDTRIKSVLPTINYALKEKARVILISHLGRPKGKRVNELSLAKVCERLSILLNQNVKFAPDCIGEEVKRMVNDLSFNDVILLENLRFYPEEEKNDKEFGRRLADLADVYINDAFATAHRGHASNVAVTNYIKEVGGGFLLKDEINYFERAMKNPSRPLVAIFGGAKVKGKLDALTNVIKKVDKIIIGGGMAFTFLKSKGYEVGKSLVEEELIETSRKILDIAAKNKVKCYLPVDCVAADQFSEDAVTKILPIQEIPTNWLGLDIGPASVTLFTEALGDAKTIIWNGPMGVFEIDAFSQGTSALVNSVVNSYALTIVGGGDTDLAIHRSGKADKISYISTGGGAFIELLEGKKLPGISALNKG